MHPVPKRPAARADGPSAVLRRPGIPNSRSLALSVAAFLSFANGFAAEPSPSSSEEIQALREHIRQLDQKLRVLERRQELRDEEAAARAKSVPVVAAGASGFGVAAPDKSFDLRFRALLQVDARAFANDNTTEGASGFLLRRIRPGLQGTVGSIYEFAFVPEFGGGSATSSTAALVDAWFAAKLSPAFGIKLGKFIAPVALEPGSNRHFVESPFPNTLLPNRDLGLEFFGTLGGGDAVAYQLGVYNGARNNTTGFAGDIDDDKTLGGRLTVAPFRLLQDSVLAPLSLGLGFSVGREKGALTAVVTNAQQTLLGFGSLAADGRHTRLSPTATYYAGPLSLVAEYAWERQEYRRSAPSGIVEGRNSAWRATAGYVLTGEDSTPKGVTPATAFSTGQGGWGALELVARASGIAFDDVLFRPASSGGAGLSAAANATGATAYGIGLNWYLNRNLRLLLNYEHTDFDNAGTGVLAASENAFLGRVQVSF